MDLEAVQSRLSMGFWAACVLKRKLEQFCSSLAEVRHSETRKQVSRAQETKPQAKGIMSVAHFRFLKESSRLKIRTKSCFRRTDSCGFRTCYISSCPSSSWAKSRGRSYPNVQKSSKIRFVIFLIIPKNNSFLSSYMQNIFLDIPRRFFLKASILNTKSHEQSNPLCKMTWYLHYQELSLCE